MGQRTGISWTGATWNPWHGCRKVSPGCKFCYMYRDKKRYGQDPTTVLRSQLPTFTAPLKWEREAIAGARVGHDRLVFTCSWSDFFIEEADAWRPIALRMMRRTPHLTYQVLTKRPERMHAFFQRWNASYSGELHPWPFPNVWLGVSVENQATADERIPWLLKTPAVVKFLSYEPALEAVDFSRYLAPACPSCGVRHLGCCDEPTSPGISWLICGGESGPHARPFRLDWAQSALRQCQAAHVPMWMKQLGSQAYDYHEYLRGRNEVGVCAGCQQCRWRTKDRAGAIMDEWPADIRIQRMPEVIA